MGDLNWKSTNVTPAQVNTEYRTRLAAAYEEAIEQLYKNDTKTKWYASGTDVEEKPATLFKSHHADTEGAYSSAAKIITGGWNEIAWTESAISAEDLIARFKNQSIIDVATADYQKFLVEKLTVDDRFAKGEDPLGSSGDEPTDMGIGDDESLTDQGRSAIEEEARKAAEASAKATRDRIKAAAAEAAGASKAATTGAAMVEIKEQCFLLAFLPEVLAGKKAEIDTKEVKAIPYYNPPKAAKSEQSGHGGNACLMAHSEPFGFINLLTQYPTQINLLDMTTSELSALQPKIQLYKVTRDATSGEETNVPVTFDSYLETRTGDDPASDLFKNKKKRGVGAGLQSFTFAYEGNNPFAVKKSITAKLSIFANTFDELAAPRGDGPWKYNYLDLALKTGGSKMRSKLNKIDPKDSNKDSNLAKLDFRLKAIVGWALPPGQSGIISSATRDAIKNSFVTLNLTPVIHNFDFDEQGRVVFHIDYFAYVEDFYNQPSFSIFSDPEVLKNMITRRLKYASLSQDCKSDELAKLRKEDKDDILEDKKKALNWLSRTLAKRNKIRYITINADQLKDIARDGPYVDKKKLKAFSITTVEGPQRGNLKRALEEFTEGKTGSKPPGGNTMNFSKQITGKAGEHHIIFFFVSDLIDVILQGIGDTLEGLHTKVIDEIKGADKDKILDSRIVEEQKAGYKQMAKSFKRLRVLLGPVELVHPTNAANSEFKNLGDLPISLKYFMEFLTEKTLKKDQVFYPLPTFLNDFFNVFLRTFLNDGTCFDRTPGMKQRVRLAQAAVTDYKLLAGELDTVSSKLVRARAAQKNHYLRKLDIKKNKSPGQPLLNIAGYRNIDTVHPASAENDYLIYYASRAQPVRIMAGDEGKDSESGVFHYRIGKDRGIVKTIKLSRTDLPGLKEARFEGGGYDGLEQLREVYNVDIETYANVSAYPGAYIFVNPLGFAPNMKSNVHATARGANKGDQFDLSNLTDYGLGGYYMIIRSSHSFGPGKADTSITARWVQEIEKQEDVNQRALAPQLDKEKDRPAKCTVGSKSSREQKANASVDPFAQSDAITGREVDQDPKIDQPPPVAPDPPL